jgi:hypothetical protein
MLLAEELQRLLVERTTSESLSAIDSDSELANHQPIRSFFVDRVD